MRMRKAAAIPLSLLWLALGIGLSCDGSRDTLLEIPAPTTYSVRGIVRQVRELPDGRTQLSVHHESIPGFLSINGEIIGMKSMTMPFTVTDAVEIDGVEPGTKIRFELRVDWSRPEPGLIIALEPLGEDTPLDFGSAT